MPFQAVSRCFISFSRSHLISRLRRWCFAFQPKGVAHVSTVAVSSHDAMWTWKWTSVSNWNLTPLIPRLNSPTWGNNACHSCLYIFAVADGPPPVPIQRCPPNQYILVTQHPLTKWSQRSHATQTSFGWGSTRSPSSSLRLRFEHANRWGCWVAGAKHDSEKIFHHNLSTKARQNFKQKTW